MPLNSWKAVLPAPLLSLALAVCGCETDHTCVATATCPAPGDAGASAGAGGMTSAATDGRGGGAASAQSIALGDLSPADPEPTADDGQGGKHGATEDDAAEPPPPITDAAATQLEASLADAGDAGPTTENESRQSSEGGVLPPGDAAVATTGRDGLLDLEGGSSPVNTDTSVTPTEDTQPSAPDSGAEPPNEPAVPPLEECTPAETRCATPLTQATCSEDGVWGAPEACDYLCAGNACTGECAPDAQRCVAGNTQSQLCNAAGEWDTTTTCVSGCDPQTGQCSGLCDPDAPPECLTTEPALRVCIDGQWVTQACDYVCLNRECTGECTPGSIRCDGNTFQTCPAAGIWEDQTECPALCSEEQAGCVALPVITEFTAADDSVHRGDATTLSWVASGAEEFTISPDVGAFDASTTSTSVTPTEDTTFTLTATNAAGSVTATVDVAVATVWVDYVRKYAPGSDAWGVVYDAANDRIVTVGRPGGSLTLPNGNVIEGPFLATHDPKDGSVLDGVAVGTDPTADVTSLALDPETRSFFVTLDASPGAVRITSNLLFSGATDPQYLGFTQVALDPQGDVWFADDHSVVRFDNNLTEETAALQVDASSGDALAIGLDDDLYVAGTFNQPDAAAGTHDAALYRYPRVDSASPSQTLVLSSEDNDVIWDVAIDSKGDVIVVGYTLGDLFSSNHGFYDLFVAKYSSDLQVQRWGLQLGTESFDVAMRVTIDDDDSILIVGFGELFGANAGASDTYVASFSPQGDLLWGSKLGIPPTTSTRGVTFDSVGHIYVAGYSNTIDGALGPTGQSAVLIRISANPEQ